MIVVASDASENDADAVPFPHNFKYEPVDPIEAGITAQQLPGVVLIDSPCTVASTLAPGAGVGPGVGAGVGVGVGVGVGLGVGVGVGIGVGVGVAETLADGLGAGAIDIR